MNNHDPLKERKLQKLQLIIHLIPLIGIIPSWWTIYRNQGTNAELSTSRLSIRLTLVWLIIYGLLWLGSLQTSEFLSLRLLYLNGLATSGYILTCLVLMFRVWQQKK
ncbi:MAG TPA: hypothetical protein DCF68_21765 [Cyanothece sp. UBA12306]|nr:hypothetical protein [Cyanothece sp. UBA12306]